ncbi:MAG: S8 family serine peptidase [Planctomycetota bacterium]|nr:S8 family serine peptidase [Planctomycetota bacterium]
MIKSSPFFLVLVMTLLLIGRGIQAQGPDLIDGKEKLSGYPEITLLIEVKDARKAAGIISKNGGRVDYDPNLGIGHDIPFLIVTLPGEKVVDESFLKSLELKSGVRKFQVSASGSDNCGCNDQPTKVAKDGLGFDTLFVPVEDIKLPELRERTNGKATGKGVKVAVIDSGVDASHPVFQNRVIFWDDSTQEGRIELKKLRVIEGEVTYDDKTLKVPERLAENKTIYVGMFDETAMGIQFTDLFKTNERAGLDFNRNDSIKDKFLVMIGADKKPASDLEEKDKDPVGQQDKTGEAPEEKLEEPETDDSNEVPSEGKAIENAEEPSDTQPSKDDEQTSSTKNESPEESKPTMIAFVDVNGDGAIKDEEAERPILDFNIARQIQRSGEELEYADMVVFPSRTKTIAYPLLFTADSENHVSHVTIGVAFNSHGTHVAGIIAGNGEEIVGAAPDAEIMALKACSGITCTESAIIRAMLKAFFNPQGYVPDVVNISLGSPEEYDKDRMDVLIQDLSAKFGTVFFVSASNSGSGYRSINHIGSVSPAVLVGAHASKETLARHYQLQEGVEVPDHVLQYFTSLGPSFTGQLRPNIVAPGSALSATSLVDDGSGMYNGTSMSSPIAAGATAALISAARGNKEYNRLEAWRSKKIKAVQDKSSDVKYSVTSIPLAIRTALEESATELPGYTLAQQGHGLLNVDAAYETLLNLATKVNNGTRLTEFKINDNSEATRLYDRSNNIPAVKRIYLTLDSDGELSEASLLKLRNAATEVRLQRVQVQSIDGTVQDLGQTDTETLLPFSIGVPGKEGEQGRSAIVVMSNGFKGSFFSIRRLATMEAGKTYIAHFDIYQHGQRLFTVLDVVHKPIELSDLKTEVNLSGIEVEESNRVACYINNGQEIKATAFHRYPVAVTDRDSGLNVQIGFHNDESGLLLVQVYDPDGYEVNYSVIRKSPQLDVEKRTGKLVVNTLEKKGIWEITVTSFSGTWLGESGYDLLIEALRFVPSVNRIQIGSKTAPVPAPPAEKMVSIMNSSRQVRSVNLNMSPLERIAPLKPFGVVPNHRTYKKLPIPAWNESMGGPKTTTVVLELDRLSKINDQQMGRIDHRLYKKGPDGKYVVAYKAEPLSASASRKIFRGIPRPEPGQSVETLYAAMEVFDVYSDGPSLSNLVDHVDMLAIYPSIPVKLSGTLSANYSASDSTRDVSLFKVTAPDKIIDETTKSNSRSSQATLKVETGDTNLPELEIKLPITINERHQHPPGAKSLERARGTLRITTDHPDISGSIPVRIAQ